MYVWCVCERETDRQRDRDETGSERWTEREREKEHLEVTIDSLRHLFCTDILYISDKP